MGKKNITWKKNPEQADYEAARAFIDLLYPEALARKLISALRKASTIERSAKDLLRASNLPLLDKQDSHVEDDLEKIHKGKPMPPVLLIRGDTTKGSPLVVADGYHRICAVRYFDEDARVRCRMVSAA